MQPENSQVMLLAADIGGTTSRFAIFREYGGRFNLVRVVRISTRQASSFAELLHLLKQGELGEMLAGCRAATMAVAGAVQGETYANPPNIQWDINLRQADMSGLPQRSTLINDFAAQAYAYAIDGVAQTTVINQGRAEMKALVAVIGAGTGLGHGLLIHGKDGYLALPSEAGHMAFAFCGKAERDYERFLLERLGLEYVDGDVVVSGKGLALLHAYHTGEELEPRQAAAALGPGSQVQGWFARFFGRACRQFALTVLPLGGLYVSGGVAANNPCLVLDPVFIDEFTKNQAYGKLLQSLPVTLNANQDSGLWGAALHARLSLAWEISVPAKFPAVASDPQFQPWTCTLGCERVPERTGS